MGQRFATQLPGRSPNFIPPPIVGGLAPLVLASPDLKLIRDQINKLPMHKSTGISGVTSHLLKPVAAKVTLVLHHLYVFYRF